MPASDQTAPEASVVVVTRNRCDDLRVALRSACAQRPEVEVIVMDDASTDGTAHMVATEFPGVRLFTSEAARGYIPQRNRAATLAAADLIVSLDDDAFFSSPDAVDTTVAEFRDPRVGAVAMPFVHTNRGPEVLQRAPSRDGIWVTNAFIGTAHALRRDVFLELGGYREQLEHFFEEPDFCIRLLRAGYVVRLGSAEPILHQESPRRNAARGVRYLSRNHLLFTFWHVPSPYVLPRALAVSAHAIRHGFRMGEPMAALQGLLAGARYVRRHGRERAPVPVSDYRRWRSLRRKPQPLPGPPPSGGGLNATA